MLCKPTPYYDEQNKVAIGYKNPLCLTRAQQVQSALYNGHEIIKTNHVSAIVHNLEDTLEIAEITRKKMNDKMKDPEGVKKKVKIAPLLGYCFQTSFFTSNLKNLYLRRTFYLLSETLDILHLTNQAMLESEAYMTYRAYASGEKTPKPKTTKKKVESEAFPKTKTTQATEGKRIKSSAKGDKAAKKKQPAETSMDKCADEGTGDIPGVPDVPTYGSDDEQISWKSSEEDDEDEVNVSENDDDNDNNDDDDDVDNQDEENQDDDDDEQTDSDNDGDDFVHPNDEDVQGTNTEEEKMIEEATHEEDEVNELYRDVNINLEGRDIMMIDAPLPNVQATQETEDTHVILTAPINPERPDTSIDSIFNTKETSMVDVLVTTIAEPPLVFATTLPLPPTPLIKHMQQTPFPIPTTALSTSLQDLPNFGSLFGFDHILKTLETDFSEFKQTNQFAEAVSSIHGIVDAYLANKMQKAVKTSIQL
ncbi:hypothetical protein Tco_1132454 [Tanacetum coccineum]|uniref:Uncharacterized protein n=1 Tax=Tanacetum coccineum TaxID=301880 RepID=A0ABQ5JC28_9ASTR